MSCGRVALERANIQVDKYYASEIDKFATQVSDKNYPDIIRMGDVTRWREWDMDWGGIELLLAGSPCQGFSFAGKQLAFDDPRSKLFFVFVDILEHIKSLNPNVKFLLENVKMKKEFEKVITETLGVEPTMINSALVSAQNRKRLYWANWSFGQPKDKGILLKDIIHEMTSESAITSTNTDRLNKQLRPTNGKSNPILAGMHKGPCSNGQTVFIDPEFEKFNINPSGRGMNGNVYNVHNPKAPTLTTNKGEGTKIAVLPPSGLKPYILPTDKTLAILDKETEAGKIACFNKGSQGDRVYDSHGESVTLCGDSGGFAGKTGLYLFGCITPDLLEKRQNGQRFSEGGKFYTLTAQDKHGILVDGYIRKLTPTECERLQTLPDGYTDGVSNSQRYKMLGNGWTVDVIAHILTGVDLI